jgi:hypothetical protein
MRASRSIDVAWAAMMAMTVIFTWLSHLNAADVASLAHVLKTATADEGGAWAGLLQLQVQAPTPAHTDVLRMRPRAGGAMLARTRPTAGSCMPPQQPSPPPSASARSMVHS